jgi:hypothetical protein
MAFSVTWKSFRHSLVLSRKGHVVCYWLCKLIYYWKSSPVIFALHSYDISDCPLICLWFSLICSDFHWLISIWVAWTVDPHHPNLRNTLRIIYYDWRKTDLSWVLHLHYVTYWLRVVLIRLHSSTITVRQPWTTREHPWSVRRSTIIKMARLAHPCNTSGLTTYQSSHIAWSLTTRQYRLQDIQSFPRFLWIFRRIEVPVVPIHLRVNQPK